MPSLGADMEAGTVVEWRVRPGDVVHRGDIVALVETEKGLIEVEIFESGTVERIVVPAGDKVPVGAVLAVIAEIGAATPGVPTAVPPPSRPAAERETALRDSPRRKGLLSANGETSHGIKPASVRTEEPPSFGGVSKPVPSPVEGGVAAETSTVRGPVPTPVRARISPLARRRAAELGVDLATITASGADGAITERDVEQAAAATAPAAAAALAPPPPPQPAISPPVDRPAAMRAAIAAAMARSKREIPHYYLGTQIDMGRAMDWLTAANLERPLPQRLLPSVLLLRAVALAVREVPDMNGFWVDGAFRPGPGIHIGVAIALRQGGLVAPAVHDTDTLDLDTLMARVFDLVKRARAGVLRSSEVADATITVTNLGDLGVETVFGVIYPPQVALVGFGKIVDRPWAAAGMLGVRPIVTASLAADHRASDGHRGGRFLAAIDRLLQEPERL